MSFYRIKRNPADVWFSYFIRFRDNWTCQLCGAKDPARHYNKPEILLPGPSNIECLHIYSRSHMNTRYCEQNAIGGCHKCHDFFTHDATEWKNTVEKKWPGRYELMRIKSKIPNSMVKRMLPQIAQEFKSLAIAAAVKAGSVWILEKDLGKADFKSALELQNKGVL